jgi:hypothetical protein
MVGPTGHEYKWEYLRPLLRFYAMQLARQSG